MKTIKHHAFTLLLCSTLAACASGPTTFADRVQAEGESKIAIADQWKQGNKDATKGEQRLVKGQKLVEKGRDDLRRGEELVANGKITVQSNRLAYDALAEMPHDAAASADVTDRAAKMEKIAKDWKQGEEQLAKGTALLTRGQQRITDGEAEIVAGQMLLDSGRQLMRQAEESYPTTAY